MAPAIQIGNWQIESWYPAAMNAVTLNNEVPTVTPPHLPTQEIYGLELKCFLPVNAPNCVSKYEFRLNLEERLSSFNAKLLFTLILGIDPQTNTVVSQPELMVKLVMHWAYDRGSLVQFPVLVPLCLLLLSD